MKIVIGLGGLALAGVLGSSALCQTGGPVGMVSTVQAWVRDVTGGWNEAACAEQPEGCLKARTAKLQEAQGSIETAVDKLRLQGGRVEAVIRERRMALAQNDLLLREGRSLVQRSPNPNDAIIFVGQRYPNREALVRQLQLLFAEKTGMERVVADAAHNLSGSAALLLVLS